jgi:hypothetical protein
MNQQDLFGLIAMALVAIFVMGIVWTVVPNCDDRK